MIETRRLNNVVIFVQTILSFVLSRKNNNLILLCFLLMVYEYALPWILKFHFELLLK